MQVPPEVAFRGFEPDDWLKRAVHGEIEKLDRYYDRIVTCRVMVEMPHRRRRDGNPYHTRIELSVPGRDLVVSRKPDGDRAREDPLVAVDEAFAAITRQLEDYVHERRGDVKRHRPADRGRVWRLFPGNAPGDRYGFLRTAAGREIYFHENSLVGADFERLDVGTEVRFHEERGVEGPQASTVRLAERRASR